MASTKSDINKGDAATGNNGISKAIFNEYYPRLVGFAVSIINDEEEAKDIVQDCFIHLLKRKKTQEDSSIQQLMFQTVRNMCINHLKHTLVKNKHAATVVNQRKGEVLYYADFCNDTLQKMVYEELEEEVNTVLKSIPSRSREAFVMSKMQGLRRQEIAERMGITTKMVDKHLKKAMDILKKGLKKHLILGVGLTLIP